jgi:hypothetical protein
MHIPWDVGERVPALRSIISRGQLWRYTDTNIIRKHQNFSKGLLSSSEYDVVRVHVEHKGHMFHLRTFSSSPKVLLMLVCSSSTESQQMSMKGSFCVT